MLPITVHLSRLLATAVVSNGACIGQTNCDTGLPQVNADSSALASGLAIIFGILGAVAVLIIIIGAFRFVWSEANPEKTAKARGTIIYALVGLIISLSAEGLVYFLLGKL